jgi:hypothetical protein
MLAENGTTQGTDATEMCPMGSMCKGMMEKPGSGFLLMIPGILLVLGGVLILVEPRILFWLVGIVLILVGLAVLFFAGFMRRLSARAASTEL